MIRLSSTQKLQAVLSGVVATMQPQVTVCYSDQTATTYDGGTTTSNLNSTTPVDIVSSPAASTVRDVDFISIYNKDTAQVTVSVLFDSAVPVQLVSVTLDVGGSLEYTHGSGWKVVNINSVVTSIFGEIGVVTQLPYVQFDVTAGVPSYTKGITYWDEDNHTLTTDVDNGVRLQHGQEMHLPCTNDTGVSIANGSAVYISGAGGDHPTIALAQANGTATSDSLIGLTTQVIADGAVGYVTIIGAVRDIDTSALSLGPVYLSPSVAGGVTTTRPSYPDRIIRVGFCTNVHATQGKIVVYTEDYADAQDILLPQVGTPVEIVDVLDWFRHSWSTGLTDGGDLTDNGDGTISIAASDFLLRQGSNEDDPLFVYRDAGTTNFAITDNEVNYVYLDYNGGTLTWSKTTTLTGFNGIDKVIAFVVARNGTRLNVIDLRKINVDSGRKNRRQNAEFDGYIYKGFWRSVLNQSSVSATGLTLQVAAGKYFYFDNPVTHSAFDTNVAGTADANNFVYFYNRTGTWTQATGQKSINATQYDVAGTLTTMNNNKYRTDWVFVVLDGSNAYLAVILGNTEYASLAAAQAEAAPATLPPQIDGASVLLAQVCILKSAASVTIRNAGATGFAGSSSTDWANPGTIGSTTPNTGAFTTLSSSGNTTLGDASTDTVTVNGHMSTGGAVDPNIGLFVRNAALTGTGQLGIQSTPIATSAATGSIRGVYARGDTVAASFTCGFSAAFYAANPTKGAGSTITNLYGLFIDDQTQGTNNYGVVSQVSTGSNKYNIYASGTAPNYFAGPIRVGTTASRLTPYSSLPFFLFEDTSSSASPTFIRNSNDIASPVLILGKSRGTVVGSFTAVTSGDRLGSISYEGTDGTVLLESAIIRTEVDGTVSAGIIPGRLMFFTANTSGSNVEHLRIDSSGNTLVRGPGGLGYGTGSGGSVTQVTSRTTGVTLNKTNGAITLVSAAGTTTWQSFTVTNSTVAATDTVIVVQKSGTDLNEIHVTAVAAGSFRISFRTTAGTTTEQPVFNFSVIKGVTS